MADAESPVNFEARQVIGLITTKKYDSRLIDFNNDSTITFADAEKYFRLLEERVAERGAADLDRSGEDVEIEIYAGGSGVIRTYAGWYPVSGLVARDSTIAFKIDRSKQVDPSALDRKILQRANAIISSDAVWNRADDRNVRHPPRHGASTARWKRRRSKWPWLSPPAPRVGARAHARRRPLKGEGLSAPADGLQQRSVDRPVGRTKPFRRGDRQDQVKRSRRDSMYVELSLTLRAACRQSSCSQRAALAGPRR